MLDRPTVWIIARHDPFEAPQPVAAAADGHLAHQTVRDLGPEHTILHTVPLLTAEGGHTIVTWWRCAATVTATTTTIAEPARMPGASHLLLPGQQLPCTERVIVDDVASQLERAVSGTHVHYIQAYATSPRRARDLAAHRARELREV